MRKVQKTLFSPVRSGYSHDSPWHIYRADSHVFSPYYNFKEEVLLKRPPPAAKNKLCSFVEVEQILITYSIQWSIALDNLYPKNHHLLTLHSLSHTSLCNRLS